MRDTPIPWIAKDQIFRRSADGTVTELTLEVGQPRELEGGDWACAITIRGLDDTARDIFGVSSLQALCLGISFARMRLELIVQKGDELLAEVDGDALGGDDLAALFGRVGSLPKTP